MGTKKGGRTLPSRRKRATLILKSHSLMVRLFCLMFFLFGSFLTHETLCIIRAKRIRFKNLLIINELDVVHLQIHFKSVNIL